MLAEFLLSKNLTVRVEQLRVPVIEERVVTNAASIGLLRVLFLTFDPLTHKRKILIMQDFRKCCMRSVCVPARSVRVCAADMTKLPPQLGKEPHQPHEEFDALQERLASVFGPLAGGEDKDEELDDEYNDD